jgi:hypothetical protein
VLNDGDEVVPIQAFALFTRLTATLERREQGSEDGPYDGLTGLKVLGPGTTPQEAAIQYVDQVLRRRLQLARAEPLHKGHTLFLALCQRGCDPAWSAADLVRTLALPVSAPGNPPPDLAGVADRLARLPTDISDGNPARTTSLTSGPLYLVVGGTWTLVAEEMSLWDAVTCAPASLKTLEPGAKFNEFCSNMIKALEAANAGYGTLVSLGLSPRDWQDLSVNTAKKVSAFLSAARSRASGPSMFGPGDDRLAFWERAWVLRPVPGFNSAVELWESPLGYALRHSQMPVVIGLEDELLVSPEPNEPMMSGPAAFERMLDRAQREAAITEFDAWFLRKLAAGETIQALATSRETRRALGNTSVSKRMIEIYVEDLRNRIEAFGAKDG